MKNFTMIFYTQPPQSEEESKKEMDAWMKWFGELKESIVDMGSPFGPNKAVTHEGAKDIPADMWLATGYTVIKAGDIDEAAKIASGCPGLANKDNSVRVYECMPM